MSREGTKRKGRLPLEKTKKTVVRGYEHVFLDMISFNKRRLLGTMIHVND